MTNEPRTIEVTMDNLKDKIAAGELLKQLERSPAFKKLILKGYFEEKAQGLVSMMGMPQDDRQRELIHNSMVGISVLQGHLRAIANEAKAAQASLEEYEQALEDGTLGGDNANG